MFCRNCGSQISDTAEFCPMCGEAVIRIEDLKKQKVSLEKRTDGSDTANGFLPLNGTDYTIDSDGVKDGKELSEQGIQVVSVDQFPAQQPPVIPPAQQNISFNPPAQQNTPVIPPAQQTPFNPPAQQTPFNSPAQQPPVIPPAQQTPFNPPAQQNISFNPPAQQTPFNSPAQQNISFNSPAQQTAPVFIPMTPSFDVNSIRNEIVNEFSHKHHNKKDYFGKVEGKETALSLFEKELIIAPDRDAFNTYRLKFRNLAIKYTNKFIKEYNLLVINLETFVRYYPELYLSNLEYLINTAMDVLAAEEVWTQTTESFYKTHSSYHHAGIDTYNTVINSIDQTIQSNPALRRRCMSYLPVANMVFSKDSDFMESAAAATGKNMLRETIRYNTSKAAIIYLPQKAELFNRLSLAGVFQNVYIDYWNVFLSLIWQLRQSGRNIWWGTGEMSAKADNMLKNLSNPRFPKEKSEELITEVIDMYPYHKSLFFHLIKVNGDTPEISALRKYFGYTDMKNPRII